MKLVDRKTFLTLPPWTLYAMGQKWYFNEIAIKMDTVGGNDWLYAHLTDIEQGQDNIFDCWERMLKTGESVPFIESIRRNGVYDENALFLVFESTDLGLLQIFISRAIFVAENPK